MKKQLSTPLIAVVIVLCVAIIGFLLYKGTSGPSEFEAPKTSKTIPKYIWDNMSPSMQQKMKDQGYTPADVKPQGQPTTSGK